MKNPRPKDVALIRPQRELMNIVSHPSVILEQWNDGVME
jgi:trehalose-6-phosphate synthase